MRRRGGRNVQQFTAAKRRSLQQAALLQPFVLGPERPRDRHVLAPHHDILRHAAWPQNLKHAWRWLVEVRHAGRILRRVEQSVGFQRRPEHKNCGVPLHEAWLYENPKALASVRRGLQDAAEGKVHDLGSFAKFADDEID